MAKPATDTRESNQEDYDTTEKISPDLDSILTELDKALEQISDRQDKHQIVRALTAAVIAQEMSRITVTKSKMVSGDLSSIDTQRLLSDWQVLSRHYAGAKHQDVLDAGIIQLRKLDLDDAQRVIHEIRCAVEPTVNWAIEEKTMKLGIEIPFLKRTGLGHLHLNFIGPNITMRRFQARAIRIFVQYGLWLAVAFGTPSLGELDYIR